MTNPTERQGYNPTERQIKALAALAGLIAETVEAAGPMGEASEVIYEELLVVPGMSLSIYQAILNVLVKQGRITQTGHVLRAVAS